MNFKVKKAAVLGSGVMGSGIACHLANVGIDVLMLDIQPKDKSIKNRNIIADDALNNAIKSKPCLLYTSPSPRDVEESRMPSSA